MRLTKSKIKFQDALHSSSISLISVSVRVNVSVNHLQEISLALYLNAKTFCFLTFLRSHLIASKYERGLR